MFNFTQQERSVVLFLTSVALLGLGINFALKVNSRITKLVKVESYITKIDVNKAGLKELLSSAGISPKLAENILAYRQANGPFRDIEELKQVKGIGDYRYDKLKGLLFVE